MKTRVPKKIESQIFPQKSKTNIEGYIAIVCCFTSIKAIDFNQIFSSIHQKIIYKDYSALPRFPIFSSRALANGIGT